MKTCCRCHIDKELSEYYKDSSRKDGCQYHCKECAKLEDRSRNKVYYEKARNRFRNCKRNAKAKDRVFGLSFEEWLDIASKPCLYCGQPNTTMGLDRVDNEQGYYVDNVVSACYLCNRMKWVLTQAEFIGHLRLILKQVDVGLVTNTLL